MRKTSIGYNVHILTTEKQSSSLYISCTLLTLAQQDLNECIMYNEQTSRILADLNAKNVGDEAAINQVGKFKMDYQMETKRTRSSKLLRSSEVKF